MRQILLTLFLLTITTPILAQKRDSVILTGQLYTPDSVGTVVYSPARNGTIDIYKEKMVLMANETDPSKIAKLKIAQCDIRDDGSFYVKVRRRSGFYMQFCDSEGCVTERLIKCHSDSVDIGDILLNIKISRGRESY